MKTTRQSFAAIAATVALAACLSAASAQAALQWDGNATGTGVSDAASSWNTANNWWTGSVNTSWADNSDVQFGTGTLGNAGAVTISGANPTVNSITFNAPFGSGNFNITGGTVNLLNTSTDITVNGGSPTISSTLAGSGKGINKKGGGQLSLNGTISYTGATTISAGVLRVNSGANTLYTSTSEFFMNGGNLAVVAGATQTIAKNFTFSSASGQIYTFETAAAANHVLSGLMTINSGAVMNIRPRNAGAFVNFDVTGKITGAGDFALAQNSTDGIDAAVKISSVLNDYSGSTTISGCRLVLGNSEVIPDGSTVTMNLVGTDRRPTLDLNGKSETIAGLSSTASGALIFNNSGAGTSTLTVGSGNASASYAGVIKDYDTTSGGIVALTKTGSGTQTLTGNNTYIGATGVNGGTLIVDGTLSGSSAVTVLGGTLGGVGTVGNVTINSGGTLSPGNSTGVFHTGSLTLDSGAKLAYDLDTPSTSDQVIAGALTLNGQQFSDFSFTVTGNFAQGVYTLIDATGVSGSLGANKTGTLNGWQSTLSVSGNDLILTVVPEPSTCALVMLALVPLFLRRRSRHSV